MALGSASALSYSEGRRPRPPPHTLRGLADGSAVDVGNAGGVGADHARLVAEEIALSGGAHGNGSGVDAVALVVAGRVARSRSPAKGVAALGAAGQNGVN